MIRIKRVYEPAATRDGRRILIERLWPRGMKKDALHMDAWMKDVAPSTELRKWFGHRIPRWVEFRRRYVDELNANPDALAPLIDAADRGTLTLLYSARDTKHNAAVVLCSYLTQRLRPACKAKRRRAAQVPA